MTDRSSKVTIYDVAQQAGVSVSSVSRVLHDVKTVKADVRERVLQAIKDLNYVPNRTAQMLKTHQSRVLIHIVADIIHPIYITLYRSVRERAEALGYFVVLIDAQHDSERVRRTVTSIPFANIDGVIISARTVGKNILQLLKDNNIPVVFTHDCDQTLFDACFPSPAEGIRLAVEHLAELGHRHIAYAGGNARKYICQQRMEAFEETLLRYNLPYDRDMVFQMDSTMNAGYRAGVYLASIPNRPTAIITETGEIALGVMQALYEKRVSIPGEISLVSGNSSLLTSVIHPRLTILSDPAVDVTRVALDYLLDRIEGRYDGPARQYVLNERTLFVRETSGPAPNAR